MSVLIPDLEVYEAVYKKACEYQHHRVCNEEYCHTLQENEGYLKTVVRDWLYLNELSYMRRYQEGTDPTLGSFLTFKGGKKIDAYQMLKFLQCIHCNIEIDTIKHGKTGMEKEIKISDTMMHSYKKLSEAIAEISQCIIAQIPKYKEANYSDIN